MRRQLLQMKYFCWSKAKEGVRCAHVIVFFNTKYFCFCFFVLFFLLFFVVVVFACFCFGFGFLKERKIISFLLLTFSPFSSFSQRKQAEQALTHTTAPAHRARHAWAEVRDIFNCIFSLIVRFLIKFWIFLMHFILHMYRERQPVRARADRVQATQFVWPQTQSQRRGLVNVFQEENVRRWTTEQRNAWKERITNPLQFYCYFKGQF